MGIIDFAQRGYNMRVSPAFNRTLSETHCISCGQCSAVCPTGAITVYNQIGKAWRAIHDPKVRTVVQIAPAVRVAVGEAFGLPAGSNALDQLVTALKYMGVDEIYDTTFAADFTTIEESREFLARLENGGPFPMFTSCCPAWVKYLELENPKYLKHISTCKSPMEMFASIVREHYQEKDAQDGRTTFHIAIMPCTAKKFEIGRPDQSAAGDGIPDVDVAITTRELARMIHRSGLRFNDLPDEDFDPAMGQATGAGHIFGATGGVMEAALRTAVETLTGEKVEPVEFTQVRGTDAIKEAEYQVAGLTLRVCVVSGTANAGKVLDMVRSGEKQYDMIEVMACPGGCVGGGGQPIHDGEELAFERGKNLYALDSSAALRFSHENPDVQRLYAEYLGEPMSHRAHQLLHTDHNAWTMPRKQR